LAQVAIWAQAIQIISQAQFITMIAMLPVVACTATATAAVGFAAAQRHKRKKYGVQYPCEANEILTYERRGEQTGEGAENMNLKDGDKCVWLCRHGRGEHNEAREPKREGSDPDKDENLIDAKLSKKTEAEGKVPGEEEVQNAKADVKRWKKKPELIVCSPLTRAIQTAVAMFEEELNAGVKLVIRPELREGGSSLENQGRKISELRADPVWRTYSATVQDRLNAAFDDFSKDECGKLWDEVAADTPGKWQAYAKDGEKRFKDIAKWLRQQDAQYIATVCHFGSIHHFLQNQPCGVREFENRGPRVWMNSSGGGFFMNSAGRIAVHMQEPP